MNNYQQACEDLFVLVNRAKVAAISIAQEQGMTPMQLFVMYYIGLYGELAMGRLATFLHCDASNITGLIDRLVVQKLVTRQESPQDRRTKTLRLTEKGQHIVDKMVAALPQRFGCDKLTAEEQQTLHTIIQKISA